MGKKYTVRCKSLDREGRGIVTFNNSSFSVPYLLPGEKADITLTFGKSRAETGAELAEVLEPSDERVEPACPYYRECGGCTWMHMSYEAQLRHKQENAAKTISELYTGEFKNRVRPQILPILGMDGKPFNYRNKVHATFGKDHRGHIVTGLYKEHTHRLISVRECRIENRKASEILRTIREFAEKRRITVYNEKTGTGVLRHVLFRFAGNGDVMVVPVVADNIFKEKNILASEIVKKHPEVKTVVLNYNPKNTTMVLGAREEVLYGNGVLEDNLMECTFRLSPRSFYQVNYKQTAKLYAEAVKFADIRPQESVVDAYCGIGTISLILAKSAPEATVTGVELNAEAVKDAIGNARRNSVTNVSFREGDAGKYLTELANAGETVDVLVMDPPRSGSSPEFLKAAGKLLPRKIVYISCEPETFARDGKELLKHYNLTYVRPVDMFPETPKTELVGLWEKRM